MYSAYAGVNYEYDSTTFRFIYESLVTPRTWYEYEVFTGKRHLLKQQPVLGDYDPKRYESKALTARAKDGARIPISVVYRKDLMTRGRARCCSTARLVRLHGSVVLQSRLAARSRRCTPSRTSAAAGLGKTWYDEGKLLKKKNVHDFVACARRW